MAKRSAKRGVKRGGKRIGTVPGYPGPDPKDALKALVRKEVASQLRGIKIVAK